MNPADASATRIITLMTDFGLEDGYVASMKGVILGIFPAAVLVDVSHLVPPQDVCAGAFLLAAVYRHFPVGTVHLAVVDPGVGTSRRGLVVKSADYCFVGPDNGLFSWVLREESGWQVYSLDNPRYQRAEVSSTFHGRDIFAPAAAHLLAGVPAKAFGAPCTPIAADWGRVVHGVNRLSGVVIHIDHFGNIITNLRDRDVRRMSAGLGLLLTIGPHSVTRFINTYAEAGPGEPAALIGSSGFLEIAVNRGNAADLLQVNRGESVFLTPREAGS